MTIRIIDNELIKIELTRDEIKMLVDALENSSYGYVRLFCEELLAKLKEAS